MMFIRLQRPMLVCACVLLAALPVIGQVDGDDQAVDDYNFAAWLYNSSKYQLAVDAYGKFLQDHSGHKREMDARFGLAQSLFHSNNFKKAAKQYEVLRDKHRDFSQMSEVLFQLAQTRVALDQFSDAESLFGELHDRYGEHYLADWAVARRAACLISLEKFAEAEALLKSFLEEYATANKLVEKTPATQKMFKRLDEAGIKARDAFLSLVERSIFYYGMAQFNQKKFSDAQKSFEKFRSCYPDSKLDEEANFRLAQSLYRQNSLVKAAAAYEPVAAGNGEFAAVAGFERGLSLYKAGELKPASAAFAEMAARFPNDPQASRAILYSGTFLFEVGDFTGAISRLKPLVDEGRDLSDEATYWTGMSLLKAGNAAKAETAFDNAMKRFAESPLVGDMQLGLADACLAQDKFDAAASTFRAFAEKMPKSEQAPQATYSACVALHRTDKHAPSDELCGEFLKKFPQHELVPQAIFLSGENRFLLKNYDPAKARYLEFLKTKDAAADRVARARFRLAWIHRHAGQYDKALAELKQMNAAEAGKTVAEEARYLEGVCLFESGKYREAVRALDAYLKAEDHSRFGDDALLKLAVSQAKDNKKDAVRSFERFIRDYAASELLSHARYQLAECLYDLKQYAVAADRYREVSEDKSAVSLAPYALFGLGLCHYDQQKWADAEAAFGKVSREFKDAGIVPQALHRQGRSLMKMRKWADAERVMGALLSSAPSTKLSRSARIAIGSCLQEQKKWSDAATAFRRAVNEYPEGKNQARVLYEIAWSWREAAQEAESVAAFTELATKFPGNPLAADANFYIAEAAYRELQHEPSGKEARERRAARLDNARKRYEKVLELSKDSRLADKAHYRIGWCYWLTENYPESAAAFDKLIRTSPKSELLADTVFQAAQSYARTGETRKAIARFERLINKPEFSDFKYLPDAYVGLSDCEMILNRPEKALKHLAVFSTDYTDHDAAARAHFIMAKARFDLTNYDAAIASFREVTKRTKSELAAEAQFYIGQVLQTQDDFSGAIVAYLRVQALYADHLEWVAGAIFESAKCSEELGNVEEARKAFEEVVQQHKGTKWARLAAERLQ